MVRVLTIRPEGDFQRWRLSLPAEHAEEVAAKGSVALNGVSLTVAGLGSDWFEVALIPTTLEATSLGRLRTGAELHLETDVLAKYVARRLGTFDPVRDRRDVRRGPRCVGSNLPTPTSCP